MELEIQRQLWSVWTLTSKLVYIVMLIPTGNETSALLRNLISS